MTADMDGPANDRDANASRCDCSGAEPVSLQPEFGKGQRMRSSGNIELLRRSRAGDVATGHRRNAVHRPRRAIGRPHGLQTAVRAARDVRAGHPAEPRADGVVQVSRGERDERRIVTRSLAGAVKAMRSPYLGNIGILILLCAISFHPCFDLAKVVSNSFLCLGAKAAFAATVNLVVDEWTPTIQAFLAGRLLRWIGLSLLLALLPVLTVIRAGVPAQVRSLAARMLVRLRGALRASLRPLKRAAPQGRSAGAVHEKVNTLRRYEA
ncbi:hypothetical protein [Bradyrhizobium japonicum]|uniref:hypothetical protein n=1 Tax=Bradyrhizobium japonicum TaxID=375 RepID=UPI001BAA9D9B|nr:hypothetical protein [Bradyrhizobium japonicum]MBR0957239.1 hypothetical protein [Bradyrhizobium japonicum]